MRGGATTTLDQPSESRSGAHLVQGNWSRVDQSHKNWTKRRGLVTDNSIASSTATSSSSYSYNAAGDLTQDATNKYSYDGFDRMTCAYAASDASACPVGPATATYTYDGLDRQASFNDGSTSSASLHYSGFSNSVADEANPTTGKDTIYGLEPDGSPVALTQELSPLPSTTQYLTSDGQGSISTVTSSSGSIACSVRYDAFGDPEGAQSSSNPCNTGSTLDDYFYQGARRDSVTGQYQFGSRIYNPATDSFATEDNNRTAQPTQSAAAHSDPLTENTFTYVNGDPVNFDDPTGYMMCRPGGSCGSQQALESQDQSPSPTPSYSWTPVFTNPASATPHGRPLTPQEAQNFRWNIAAPVTNSSANTTGGSGGFLNQLVSAIVHPFTACSSGSPISFGSWSRAGNCTVAASTVLAGVRAISTGVDVARSALAGTAAARAAVEEAAQAAAPNLVRGGAADALQSGDISALRQVFQDVLPEQERGPTAIPNRDVQADANLVAAGINGQSSAAASAGMSGALMKADDIAAAESGLPALNAGSEVSQWAGPSLSRVTQTEESMYRVWGGGSGQAGEWLTPINPMSSAAARAGLALPEDNAATFLSRVLVPLGTRIQVGVAGEAFGQAGGWAQVRLLEEIPLENFGKGIPLAP